MTAAEIYQAWHEAKADAYGPENKTDYRITFDVWFANQEAVADLIPLLKEPLLQHAQALLAAINKTNPLSDTTTLAVKTLVGELLKKAIQIETQPNVSITYDLLAAQITEFATLDTNIEIKTFSVAESKTTEVELKEEELNGKTSQFCNTTQKCQIPLHREITSVRSIEQRDDHHRPPHPNLPKPKTKKDEVSAMAASTVLPDGKTEKPKPVSTVPADWYENKQKFETIDRQFCTFFGGQDRSKSSTNEILETAKQALKSCRLG